MSLFDPPPHADENYYLAVPVSEEFMRDVVGDWRSYADEAARYLAEDHGASRPRFSHIYRREPSRNVLTGKEEYMVPVVIYYAHKP